MEISKANVVDGDTNHGVKVNKRTLYKWFLFVMVCWISSEAIYQLYLRSKWIKNGEYQWEDYVVERNKQRFLAIEDYFKSYSGEHFYISYKPDEGSLDSLPKEIQRTILGLKKDLLSGLGLFEDRQRFDLEYKKVDSKHYKISIIAGTTFKSSYNGYDFRARITNDTFGCERTVIPNIYVCKDYLKQKEYKSSTPFILRYNCNSFDLLILKLFWR